MELAEEEAFVFSIFAVDETDGNTDEDAPGAFFEELDY
jgi:hypothetical protein